MHHKFINNTMQPIPTINELTLIHNECEYCHLSYVSYTIFKDKKYIFENLIYICILTCWYSSVIIYVLLYFK